MTTCFQKSPILQFEDRITSVKMPDSFCGSWEIVSNINFEGYMVALGKLSKLVLNIASASQTILIIMPSTRFEILSCV